MLTDAVVGTANTPRLDMRRYFQDTAKIDGKETLFVLFHAELVRLRLPHNWASRIVDQRELVGLPAILLLAGILAEQAFPNPVLAVLGPSVLPRY